MAGGGAPRLLLRAATTADAAEIEAIYAPIVRDTPISFETEPPTVAEIERRIAATLPRYPYLVAESDGRFAGYAYASEHRARLAYRTSADVTVYVAADMRGRGIGRALYEALLPDLAGRGYHLATAGITLPNAASVALHEAVGFTRAGVFTEVGYKLGAFHDVGWWQRLL